MPFTPQRASISQGHTRTFPVTALLRRFSTPSPYSAAEQAAQQSPIDPMAQAHDQLLDSSLIPSGTVHQYNLKSRGKNYALITVISHALNAQNLPLLYFGEELKGFIVLSLEDLGDMQSMDVVLQMFDSDIIAPSYEAKRTLSSQQVINSHITEGQFRWPFSLVSPTPSVGPSSSSSVADSSLGHQLSSDQKFQLIVTIYRRGRLNRNVGVRQELSFVPPPDPSVRSSPPPLPVNLPNDPAPIPWPEQRFPRVLMKGVMFRQVPIEVECKLIAPKSYPISDIIPLRLTVTSENREALDLLSVSNVIDVRLQKVMAFGKHATAIHPLTLRNRKSYHRVDLAAKAHWELDSYPTELPVNEGQSETRWRMKLNGKLHREPRVEFSPSFEEPGIALMYILGLYPFHSTEFRPASDPDRALVMGKIQLVDRQP